jgi:hypothetical protein
LVRSRGSTVLVKYTCYGDADFPGSVEFAAAG